MTTKEDLVACEKWLRDRRPDLAGLNGDTKAAILQFVLVWSLFDFNRLGASGRLADVNGFIENHIPDNDDIQQHFMPLFEYFQRRYLNDKTPNHRLAALCGNDYQTHARLREHLVQLDPSPKELIGSLLLISYRLRCNLIHGQKWSGGLNDQLENFINATKAMMHIMDDF